MEELHGAGGSLAAAGEAAADSVRAIQAGLGGRCGTCDATTREFYDELSEYLKLEVGQYIADFFQVRFQNRFIAADGQSSTDRSQFISCTVP